MAHRKQLSSWWVPLLAGHHRHPKMVALLEQHGAPGPNAFTVLLGEGASVPPSGDRGQVKMGWSDFARYAGTEDIETARNVMASMGELELVELVEDQPHGFTVRLVKWAEWDLMPKDPGAAERKRKQRERDANRSPNPDLAASTAESS
jgi:hypothetical protein